ncbi:MAG: ATP-dependent helicase/nuclease subunit B [Thalassomonas sp.]|jgi:ATP-dependent helicase/nuclease subunit B
MMPFLAKIADRLLERFPESMEGVAVVLPSKRAVVFLKHYLTQRINKPIFLPEFYAIEEFAEQLSGLQVLDNMSLQFRLYKAYLQHPPQKVDSFDDFLNWSNVLLHDFNEIDRNIIDAKAIYTNLKNVKELEGWSVEDWSFANTDLTPMQTDYSNFFEGMRNWYTSFRESLLSENLAYQGLAYRMAAEQIAKRDISWKKVWFVGLNALTKSEQEIVDFLKKEDIARVFWDADKFYYDNPMHEAGGFLREQRAKWSEIDFKGVGDYYGVEKEKFQAIACPKNTAQAKVVAEVIKGFSIADLEDSNTAIVLADEALLFPVLNNLPSAVKQLNVTMGSPLKNSTLFSFVEVLFAMQIHAINYKRNAFYYKDVIAVVEHPYFSKITDEKAVLALKKFIIKDNIVFVSKGNIHSLLLGAEKVEKLFKIWETVDEALQCLDDLVLLLRKPLVGKKGTIASEVLATFSKSLLMLKKLAAEVDFDFELKTLQTVLKQLVSKEMIPFKGEPLKGVQLMGILESRTLDFKNVIMLSVNEGKLPKGKSVNSFIPYDMKRYFKLPTYAESDAVFAYHFYRLLQRANNVTLVYNSETDDFGSGEKSRFITQLLSEYKTTPIQQLVYKGADLEVKNPSEIVVKNNGLEAEIKSWAANGVSPSALNKYTNCSLSFYYHYLAKIREDDQVEEYADSSTMGTAVHDALEKHYPIGVLTEKIIKEITPSILKEIENNFITALSKQGMQEGKNYLSLQIAQKLTKDFLNLEQRLIKEANTNNKQIKLVSKEEVLAHDLMVDGLNFKLIGKVDRVDFDGDILRIIDYKTGKVEEAEVSFTEYNELTSNNKKAKAFQLLMYAYLYLKMNPNYMSMEVVAGNFAFKNLKSGLLKVSKKIGTRQKEVISIDVTVMNEVEEQLEFILSQIKNEDFTQVTDVKACEWCDYKSICKR